MNFRTAAAVEQVVWEMKLSDYKRGENRSKINDLFGGMPPYTDDEVQQNKIATNVNFLEASNIAHNARRQFGNAFLNPDPLFVVTIDHGPRWKRSEWGNIITKEINRIIKRSLPYMETLRSVFAQDVLHGIAPAVWKDKDKWNPKARGVEDVLVPSNTELDLEENLPFFAIYEQYTGPRLWRMTHGPHVDPGWNMPVVDAAIKWVDQQAQQLMSSSWPEVWSPEKMSERIKQDGGLYASDSVPTVDCYRFFWYNDDNKKAGWSQKIILDAWGQPGVGDLDITESKNPKRTDRYGLEKSMFLYDSGNRKYAEKIGQIAHFQFADGSCVAPFRYHSVRSLGWLLYSVCHLQNRLRCKFNDALFESLMQYFRINNMGDAERALRIDLTDKTPLPDGVQFVRPEERWQVPKELVMMGLQANRQLMDENSASYSQDFESEGNQYETATKTMAKVNSSAALVNAMLQQAYNYQNFQYIEICRRFCKVNSSDADVRQFRLNCLKAGVPEEMLDITRWDVQAVRVIGSGNKMMQSAMMDKVMGLYYTKLDPTAQREALRMGIATTMDDYQLADRWVPDQKQVSDSVHDAQMSASAMLQGLPMALKEGVNHDEYIEALLVSMHAKVQQVAQSGGVGTPADIMGLQNLAGMTIQGQSIPGNGIQNHIKIVAEDEKQPHSKGEQPDHSVKQKVKQFADTLKELMNQVKAFAQRQQEQQQKQQQQGNGGMDPKDIAKVKGMQIQAQTKAQLAKESHASRTAQKQISFEQKLKQDQEKHQVDLAKTQAEAMANLSMTRMKSQQE